MGFCRFASWVETRNGKNLMHKTEAKAAQAEATRV